MIMMVRGEEDEDDGRREKRVRTTNDLRSSNRKKCPSVRIRNW